MIKRILSGIWLVLRMVEVVVSLLLTVAILVQLVTQAPELWRQFRAAEATEGLDLLIAFSFSLIIAVEFVKMICRPNPSTVIEVILFALARYLVLNHSSPLGSLLGVLAVAVLFATRKFFFHESDLKPQTNPGLIATIQQWRRKRKDTLEVAEE